MEVGPRAGADLEQVAELRRVLGHRHWDVAGAARDVGAALRRCRARSREYVPDLPGHEARGLALADRLDALASRVGRTRDALAAADRWVGTGAALRALDIEAGRQALVVVRQQGPASWARLQRWALDLDTGGRRWTAAQVRDRVGHLPRAEAAAIARRWTAADQRLRATHDAAWQQGRLVALGPGGHVREARRDVLRLVGRGDGARGRLAATLGDDAGRVGRALGALSDTRLAAVGRLAGRGVAVGGIVLGGVAAWQGYRDGDTEQVVGGSLAVAAGVAMLVPCPPVQLVGAVVSAGLLAYQHREALAGVASDAAEAVGDIADAAWDAVSGLF